MKDEQQNDGKCLMVGEIVTVYIRVPVELVFLLKQKG